METQEEMACDRCARSNQSRFFDGDSAALCLGVYLTAWRFELKASARFRTTGISTPSNDTAPASRY
jgi:hypothetical protein